MSFLINSVCMQTQNSDHWLCFQVSELMGVAAIKLMQPQSSLLLLIQVSCERNAAKPQSLQIEQSQLRWAAQSCQANSTCRWYAAQWAGAHHDVTTRQILHNQVQPLLILHLFPLLKLCNSGQDELSDECMTACRRRGCSCTRQ